MKFESKEAAVFFIDILGMSALTQGIIDLSKINEKIDTSIYEIEINGVSSKTSPNQIIATWTLSKFREILRKIHFKYDIHISQLSDCAFIWSENPSEVILASSDLMWQATLSGILCRGGLSYGEVIVPLNDKDSFGSFILGDAVTRAAKHEASGKGCRVFTDAEAVTYFHQNFPGSVNSPALSSKICNKIFAPITNPLDCTVYDEFKWYLYFDLRNLLSANDELNKEKMAMYMAGLVSKIKHSPYYAWNSLTTQGQVQLAASIDVISSHMSEHTGHDDAKISAEYAIVSLNSVNRSNKIVKKYFYQYNVNSLSTSTHEKMKQKLELEVAEQLFIE
jgi:hypothetical protein